MSRTRLHHVLLWTLASAAASLPLPVLAAAVTQVKDINTHLPPSDPSFLAVAGSKVYFAGFRAPDGYELAVSDGTAAATSLIKDLNPGSCDSTPLQFTTVGANVFFRATTAANGFE